MQVKRKARTGAGREIKNQNANCKMIPASRDFALLSLALIRHPRFWAVNGGWGKRGKIFLEIKKFCLLWGVDCGMVRLDES